MALLTVIGLKSLKAIKHMSLKNNLISNFTNLSLRQKRSKLLNESNQLHDFRMTVFTGLF